MTQASARPSVRFSLAFRHALAHDAGMVGLSFSDEARALIDPAVVPHGFASGQGDGLQVIFCASLDELAARFPGLPQVGEQQRDSGACIDLVVTADDQMNLATVQLEGVPLDETLRRVGLAGRAEELRAVMRADRTHALTGVAAALRDLLAASD